MHACTNVCMHAYACTHKHTHKHLHPHTTQTQTHRQTDTQYHHYPHTHYLKIFPWLQQSFLSKYITTVIFTLTYNILSHHQCINKQPRKLSYKDYKTNSYKLVTAVHIIHTLSKYLFHKKQACKWNRTTHNRDTCIHTVVLFVCMCTH